MDMNEPTIVQCVVEAASHYGADPRRVLASIKTKDGRNGEIRVLENGEVELGLARIPAKEVPALEQYGITADKLSKDACLNVSIATYLLQRDQLKSLPAATPAKPMGKHVPPDRCMVTAAERYHIPLPIMQAVIKTEGGWDGLKKRNTNGSYDLGRAQINTIHLPELSKYGITESQLANDPCTNLHVAAYRLRFEINRVDDFWRGVGNYHSRTPHLNKAYRARVQKNLASITTN